MRTIAEIKDNITADFMNNEAVAGKYGFTPGDSFTEHFGKASIESLLFYVFACAAWVLENLFDAHRKETETLIDDLTPHRPKWYRDRVLAFMKGYTLIPDTDRYDTSGMSEDVVNAARVVKHAVAVENANSSILTIKVAGEKGGTRCKLDGDTEIQLSAYIAEIKDAGVRTALVNAEADKFDCEADVYYDPMLLPESVQATCREAVKNYVENLPFNGEYTNMALVDALQAVDGVKIVELRSSYSRPAGMSASQAINARCVPEAGYFTVNEVTINMIAYNG